MPAFRLGCDQGRAVRAGADVFWGIRRDVCQADGKELAEVEIGAEAEVAGGEALGEDEVF